VAQDGKMVRTVVQAVSGLILAHGNVVASIEAVLDAPVGTDDTAEAFGRQRSAEEVIVRFGGGPGGEFAGADDLGDGGQAGSLMMLLELGDVGGDHGGAGFDPPVIAIDARMGGRGGGFELRVVQELFDIGVQGAWCP
jgi:hypothetical protein